MLANNFIVSLFKSFGLHIFIGVGLVASVTLSPTEKPKPVVSNVEPVKAVSVDTNKLTEQVNKIRATKAKKQAAERKRVEDLEARANRAANKRKNQETKIKDGCDQNVQEYRLTCFHTKQKYYGNGFFIPHKLNQRGVIVCQSITK